MRLKRKNLTSPRLQKKRRNTMAVRSIFAVILICGGVLAGRALLGLDFVSIKSVKIIGAESVNAAGIEAVVNEELAGKWFGIIPKNNFLFFGQKSIAEAVQKSFPNIESAKAVLAGVGALAVEVKERTARYVWCKEGDGENCFAIDGGGYAFEKIADGDILTIATIWTASAPQLKEIIFESKKFKKLDGFIGAFSSAGFNVAFVTEQDYDFLIGLVSGGKILVKQEDKPEDIVEKLSSIIDDYKKQGRAININYIDLRFGNKVFIKMN